MGRGHCRETLPPAQPGPPTHTPPTVPRGGGARTTSRGREDGGNERKGRPTAPQPANRRPLTQTAAPSTRRPSPPPGQPAPRGGSEESRGPERWPAQGSGPPSWWLAARDWNHQAAPPRPWGGGARGPGGDCGEPPLPLHPPPPAPPPPPPPRGRPEAGRKDGGPATPRECRGTQGGDATAAGSAAVRQAPPVDRPLTPALPAADQRLRTGAVARNGTAAPRNGRTKRRACKIVLNGQMFSPGAILPTGV